MYTSLEACDPIVLSREDDIVNIEEVKDTNEEEPTVGMKFGSMDEVYEFYKRYGERVGFPIRIRSTKKEKNVGVINNVTCVCAKEGNRKSSCKDQLEPQPTIKSGCKAKLIAIADTRGVWRINTVWLEHNHENSPTKPRLYKCYRVLNEGAKRQLVINDVAGIPMYKTFQSSVVEAGGYANMTFAEKDCGNYVSVSRVLDPKCSKRKGASPKNRKPGPLEKKARKSKPRSKPIEQMAVAPSTEPPTQPPIQTPIEMQQFPFFNPDYFSQQLMGAHYQQCGPSGAMNVVPIFATDQHNTGSLNFVANFSTDQHNDGGSG